MQKVNVRQGIGESYDNYSLLFVAKKEPKPVYDLRASTLFWGISIIL